MTGDFQLVVEHPLIEEILGQWRDQIGAQWSGYRGHVYRMFNCCLALRACSAEETAKLAVAAAFHDLGLWSDRTLHIIRFGIDRGVLKQLRRQFPNAGFHGFLAKTAAGWFLRHPLSPPPFLRW